MYKIRIGVICPSEIAFRRFMPAIIKCEKFEFVGIASANEAEWFGDLSKPHNTAIIDTERKKAQDLLAEYGGKLFESYMALLTSDEIEAVYLPLPPALHFKWAKIALEHGKHVFLEKPFTTLLTDTQELIKLAEDNHLAVHENYMFQYHSQIDYIKSELGKHTIGDIRLIRIAFGFPFRGNNDFRYNKAMGGGALMDCGGYTVKLATMLLGESAKVVFSQLNSKSGFDVDLYGSATLINDAGLTAQLSFGMDNSYKCELELWGSTGAIFTNRILTAPEGFEPSVTIKTAEGEQTHTLQPDDSFLKSIQMFGQYVRQPDLRIENNRKIWRQASLVETFYTV
ncbi:MAG: Gfo/Idh/MocA family oxidoreductase [Hydrogenoanaerobacterium sp.]